MSDLLVRNIDSETKEALACRAARNGRSQQAEARAILEKALRQDSCSWIARLRNAAEFAEGFDLNLPARHPARNIETEGWL